MRARRFFNWARTCSATPAVWAEPVSEDEVAGQVRGAASRGARVKVVGAGHSWSDIACTDGTLLSLDRLGRVLEIDEKRWEVTVEAGIRLRTLNAALSERGLALPVLGSIAEQSVAGAISTGTHGSAPRLPNLSGLVTGLRMVLADGSVADLSANRDPELFAAARVGLGALGVITRVTLRCVPAFRLEELCEPMRFDDAIGKVPDLHAREEFVKLWWLPHTDSVQAHQEIEYALPRDLAAEALRRTRALVERDRLRVNFIAELRFGAGDDAWMSPDYGRDSAHLGAYMAPARDLPRYFAAFEAEMLALGGRPHWGKQFSAAADQLRAAYPEYERFDALRRKLDPKGMFENAFLTRVFRGRSETMLAQRPAARAAAH